MSMPVNKPAASATGDDHSRARGASTRDTLLRAAGEQFALAGYQGASLGNILLRAGVTKGALYFHFENKEALAAAVVAETIERKRTDARSAFAAAADPMTGLVAAIDAVVERGLSDPVVRGGNRLLDDPMMPTKHAVHNYVEGENSVRRMLQAAGDAALLRPRVNLDMTARTIMTLVAGHRLICGRTDTIDQLPIRIEEMWRGILPLIATDEWLRAHPRAEG